MNQTITHTSLVGKSVSCRLGYGQVVAVYLDRHHVLTLMVQPPSGVMFSVWAQECCIE